jgi:hypothetical protein
MVNKIKQTPTIRKDYAVFIANLCLRMFSQDHVRIFSHTIAVNAYFHLQMYRTALVRPMKFIYRVIELPSVFLTARNSMTITIYYVPDITIINKT